MIKIDAVSEDDDDPEAKGALRHHNEDLGEASRPTTPAVAAEGGQSRPRSAATRTFCIARGESEEV